MIATLNIGEPLTILYGVEVAGGIVWVQVVDSAGRIGWIPQVYLLVYTPIPTTTATPTPFVDPSGQTSTPTAAP